MLVLFLVSFNLSLKAVSTSPSQDSSEKKVEFLNGVSQVSTNISEFYINNYSDIGLTVEYVQMIGLVGTSCSLLGYQNIVKLIVKAVVIGKEFKDNQVFEYKDLSRINEEMNMVYENLDYAFKNEGEACLTLAPELKAITIEYWSRVYESVEAKIKPYLNNSSFNNFKNLDKFSKPSLD
jgi:hypothetical protein